VRFRVLLLLLSVLLLPTSARSASQTDDLVERINRARIEAGVLPLARSTELDAAAQTHSADMVQHDYLDHTGSDGSEPQQRAAQAGYRVPPDSAWIVVEVISAISADPQGPVDWWLNESEQHSRVLLNPRWREVGAGYASGGEYGNYWTALFGCRPGVLPSVSFNGNTYTPHEECGDPTEGAALAPTYAATPAPTVSPTRVPTLIPTPVPTLVPTPVPHVALSVAPGAGAGVVSVRWNGISQPRPTDWIGVYRPGDADAAYLSWSYVGCSTEPLDARALGACTLVLPTGSSGAFEVRLFRDNGYARLAATSAALN
jgi:cysteine-rich secretory family protein